MTQSMEEVYPLGLISRESQVRILPLQPVLGYFQQQIITLLEIKQKAYPVILFHSSTAVVQLTVNQLVVGSIPASGAKQRRTRSIGDFSRL